MTEVEHEKHEEHEEEEGVAPRTRMGIFSWEGILDTKQWNRLQYIAAYYTEDTLGKMLIPIISRDDAHPQPRSQPVDDHDVSADTPVSQSVPDPDPAPSPNISQNKLSLRALDWLVTNYSKKMPIVYKATPPKLPPVLVNVHNEYKNWLHTHKRRNFDMFRRRKRIFFTFKGEEHRTTVGQLNFFYWASRYGVLAYARTHIDDIESDHAMSTKRSEDGDSKKPVGGIGGIGGEMGMGTGKNNTKRRKHKKRKKRDGVASSSSSTGVETTAEKTRCEKPKPAKRRRRRRELSKAPNAKCFVYNIAVDVVFDPLPV